MMSELGAVRVVALWTLRICDCSLFWELKRVGLLGGQRVHCMTPASW